MPRLASDEDPRAPQIELLGQIYDRIPNKEEHPDQSICPDCEAADGEIHELGCDGEDCPRCGGQLIGCGCLPAPEDEE